jgi:SNF family Na+-dependent transporter
MQVVFSLQLGLGTFSTLASYNKFGHNLVRDALIGKDATNLKIGF